MNLLAFTSIALLAIQVAVLGFWVSIVRSRVGAIYHAEVMDPASPLAKAVRAHGNASEYAGVLAGLFIAISLLPATARDTWPPYLMLGITAARCLGSIGFISCETLAKVHPLKALSALVTYAGMLALAIHLLLALML
jgi:uncharacterized membrane protein YecN with MAPEG domain